MASTVNESFAQRRNIMSTLLIINEAPYGNERSYNGLRLAKALAAANDPVTVFLMADAVNCAKRGQKVPEGFYNIELMLKAVARHGKILLCGTCMDARGLGDSEIIEGAQRSTMKELAETTIKSDKVLVF
jgi:uncharacterized protein involved in oxidation of intracellular sulfur